MGAKTLGLHYDPSILANFLKNWCNLEINSGIRYESKNKYFFIIFDLEMTLILP